MAKRTLQFLVGQEFGEGRIYRIQSKGRSTSAGAVAEPLGKGGQAAVYRVTYKDRLDAALKILNIDRDLKRIGDSEPHKRTFEKEKSILARLTHTNLAKVLDFGVHVDGEYEYPYIVTEFVDGEKLHAAWTLPDMTGRRFLKLFQDVLSAVEFLNRHGVLHADIKEDNILFRDDGPNLTPFLLDLGVAKVVAPLARTLLSKDGDAEEELLNLENTIFYSTPNLMPDVWRDRLGQEITQDQLVEMTPAFDLYSISLLLDNALAQPDLRARIVGDLHKQGIEGLDEIAQRLKVVTADRYYPDASAVQDDLAKLDPHYLAPLGVPELALSARYHHSLTTMRERIVVTDRLHEVISHPVFQRLRDIPQLELVSQSFPAATHTRMLHSLSALGMAKEYIAQLLNHPKFRLAVTPDDLQAALLYALLHDIGHYPLSHMFEDFSEEQRRHPDKRTPIPTDDDLFWTFLDPKDHALEGFDQLAEVLAARGETLAELITSIYNTEVFESMRALLSTSKTPVDGIDVRPGHTVLAGLLSSAIDVDKVAYLSDDSFATGVAYGKGIDFDGLLGSLTIPPDDVWQRGRRVIAITEKGLSAAESVATARYFMLRQVYWHHTNRAVMSMFKSALGLLIDSGHFDMRDYLAKMAFGTQQQAFDYISEAFDRADTAGWYQADQKPEWFNPAVGVRKSFDGVLNAERRIYKRLLEVSVRPATEDAQLWAELAEKSWHERLETQECLRQYLSETFEGLRGLKMGDVVIDVPIKEREGVAGRGGGEVWVYLSRRSGHAVELKNASPIVAALDDEYDLFVKKCRVYIHPDFEPADEEDLARVSNATRDFLAPTNRGTGMS